MTTEPGTLGKENSRQMGVRVARTAEAGAETNNEDKDDDDGGGGSGG